MANLSKEIGPAVPLPALLLSGGVVALYLLYLWLLPKPLPGIPYRKQSAKRLLGDIPDLMKEVSAKGEMFPWIGHQSIVLKSPIFQLFMRPFGKPWVVVTDYREVQDILQHRIKEFDRSDHFYDLFHGVIPEHHICKKTDDENFKRNRNLVNPLMTPNFLNQIAAPQLHSNILPFLDFWSMKTRVADGHPFNASEDIFNVTLDIIFSTALELSSEYSAINAQHQLLARHEKLHIGENVDEPVDFPNATLPPILDAILTLTDSVGGAMKSPSPSWYHAVIQRTPRLRKARAVKDSFIRNQFEEATKRFAQGDRSKTNALQEILHRELNIAEKEQRAPVYNSAVLYDELLGILLAGHDTTSTTMCWAVKRFSDHMDSQKTLRNHLRNSYPEATAAKRNPTVQEIVKIPIPYLDAVLEEILRVSFTSASHTRVTVKDATIFGHHIPKGTDLLLAYNSPGLSSPAEVEHGMSKSSLPLNAWDPQDIMLFKPERWLETDSETGKVSFNPKAGPALGFGLGPRGCWGKRLAYLQMRFLTVLLIWNFEFQKCPDELSTYGGLDNMTRQPSKCFVRLARAEF